MQFLPSIPNRVATLRSPVAILGLITGLAALLVGAWFARSQRARLQGLLVAVLGGLQLVSALDLWGQPVPAWVDPVLLALLGGIALLLIRRASD